MLSTIAINSSLISYAAPFTYEESLKYSVSNNVSNSALDYIPSKYDGVDLFRTNFDITQMTENEKELYNYLIDREVDKYILTNHSNESKAEVRKGIEDILTSNSINSSNDSELSFYSSAPWWHLNTVSKVGAAIDVVISAGIASIGGGLASAGIRGLIAKVGEAEAKKIVQNVVVNKVKNTLIAWGMSGMASKVSGSLLTIIMWAADPGTQIAEKLDSVDAHPNNGYLEIW